LGINFYIIGNYPSGSECNKLILKDNLFGMLLASLHINLNTNTMKKKIKKSDQSFKEVRFNSSIYQNYDLEMRLVQNINKDKPQYSLD